MGLPPYAQQMAGEHQVLNEMHTLDGTCLPSVVFIVHSGLTEKRLLTHEEWILFQRGEERGVQEPLAQQIPTQYLLCGPNMEDTPDQTADLFSDQNQSFKLNMTAANTSSVFVDVMSPEMNKAINILMIICMLVTMVSMGCTMEVSKIKHHIVKPKGVAIALLAQYGVMPLTAFCLAKMFQLADMLAVVVLICGCCPGGSLSNLLALALKGDMNLSLVMTSCSTLLALGMMPLLLYLYCQGFDLQNAVPYVDIIISLALILIPCGAGILINHYRPQLAKTVTKAGLIYLGISMVVIATVASFAIGDTLLTVLSPPLMAIAALMPFIGYVFGYVISSLFRLSQPERRTVAMETGCQNIQLCFTILKLAFPPELIGPLFLFPMVYVIFQVMEAVLLITLFWGHHRFTRKQKEKVTYQPATTEEKLKEASEGTV